MNKSAPALMIAALCCVLYHNLSAADDMGAEWRYTVRPGDTLIGFSKRYLIEPANWGQLHKINKLIDPNKLRPGQTLRIPLALLKQTPAPAIVMNLSGEVTVLESSASSHLAKLGESLGVGAVVKTAENSSATLKFADDTLLNLQPNSEITLDTMSVYEGGGMVDTKLRLQRGRGEIKANPKHQLGNRMQIVTPSAVAAVRGTTFRVAADADSAREETLEGNVALSAAAQEVSLPAGFGSVAKAGQAPSAPVMLLDAPNIDALPKVLERLPMRFDISPQDGAVAWLGQVAQEPKFEQVLLEKTSEQPRLVFGDLPDGQYLLRVRASDKLGLQGQDAVHKFELNARPFFPLLLTPKPNGVVRNPLPEITWSETSGVKAYHLELANDESFQSKLISETTSTLNLKSVKALEAGDYYIRIASIDELEQGPYSDTIKFTYKPAPLAPDLQQSALTFDDKTMFIQLPKPLEGLRYEVLLSADKAGKQMLWQGDSLDGLLQIPRPYSGKRYLSVRQVESDGTASPYATQAIEVPDKAPWNSCLCSVF